jgi:hypothetical protein
VTSGDCENCEHLDVFHASISQQFSNTPETPVFSIPPQSEALLLVFPHDLLMREFTQRPER